MAILLLWDIQSNTYVWQVNQGGGRNEYRREQGGQVIVKDAPQPLRGQCTGRKMAGLGEGGRGKLKLGANFPWKCVSTEPLQNGMD